jgi:hypothetical protein
MGERRGGGNKEESAEAWGKPSAQDTPVAIRDGHIINVEA